MSPPDLKSAGSSQLYSTPMTSTFQSTFYHLSLLFYCMYVQFNGILASKNTNHFGFRRLEDNLRVKSNVADISAILDSLPNESVVLFYFTRVEKVHLDFPLRSPVLYYII